jgi:putative nucleotidyltransferase with HDIG domain
MEENDTRQAVLHQMSDISRPERPVYLVGGAVRDTLLQRTVHDLDFAVKGGTRKLANELACRLNGAMYVMDEQRDTTRVVLNREGKNRLVVDFASMRGIDLEADLRSRDFTINAMAYDVSHPDRLIDPTGGLDDLREKRLRACSDASFTDDPVRVLRMVRQALEFGFRIERETLRLAKAAARLLPNTSIERRRDELFRMLDRPRAALGIRLLDQVGALPYVLPELDALKGVQQSAPHRHDVWQHTLRVVEYLEQLLSPLVGRYREETVADLTTGSAVLWLGRYREQFAEHFEQNITADRSPRSLLMLAALYHDVAKPETQKAAPDGRVRFFNHDVLGAKTVARRGRELALSAAEIQRVERIVEHHMRVNNLMGAIHKRGHQHDEEERISRRAVYRFFHDAAEAGVDVCLLALADLRGTYDLTLPQPVWEAALETCRILLESYWEKRQQVVAPVRFLSGSELMESLGLAPGPLVGQLLEAIREGQAAGEIGDREAALEYSRRWVQQNFSAETASGKEGEEERDGQ